METKHTRSEQAPINGAKSRGPVSVERLVRYLWELRRLDDARHQQYLDAMTTVRRPADAARETQLLQNLRARREGTHR